MKKKAEPQKDSIRIIPLGGLGAVGKNMTLFEYRGDIIIVDCGLMFPGEETPGVDYLIPDFSYLKKNRKRIKAIIITHGHEDHIGAIPYLLRDVQAPIYGTRLTLGLIQSRISEHPLTSEPDMREVSPRETISVGGFSIEFIRVNHSIIGGVGLAITTETGTIIHTGDFKIDFSPVDGEVLDIYRFAHYGEQGVLLLMSDSTNAEKTGFTLSETMLADRLIDIFSSAKGRIIAATFASNIHRIQQLMDVAQRFNRKVVISGLSMQKNVEISRSLGFLTVKDDLILNVEEAKGYPDKKLVIIGTGTQGEPMSALSRMAGGTHRHFTAKAGDTVIITASVIPGNEIMVTRIVNNLMSLGAEVYYDQDEAIHVSGHGASKELKLMLSITKPKFFMPIHGEFKHMKAHTEIAESLGIKPSHIIIAENGDILELTKKNFLKTDSLDLARIYVHGDETGNTESSVISDRQKMATDGVMIINAFISGGKIQREPEIYSRGVLDRDNRAPIETIKKDVTRRIKKLLQKKASPADIEESLQKGLENLLYRTTRRNSLIIVRIFEV